MNPWSLYLPTPSGTLLDGFLELFADALHAGDGGVAVLLLDVMQFDELYAVVLADDTHRFVDLFPQFGVQD